MAVTALCLLLSRAPLAPARRLSALWWCRVRRRLPWRVPSVCRTPQVLLKSLFLVPSLSPASKLCPPAQHPLITLACLPFPPCLPLSLLPPSLHPCLRCLPPATFQTIRQPPSTKAWRPTAPLVQPPRSAWASPLPPLYSQASHPAPAPLPSQGWEFQEGMVLGARCCHLSWDCQGPLRLQ